MKHKFAPEAAEDYQKVTLHYLAISKRLGHLFVQEVESGIETIKKFPEAWPRVDSKTRCFFGRKFPYGIYYRIKDNTAFIGGIINLKQRPGLWKKRFK